MPVQLRRLWIQLTSNRKRFGLLCAALCVGMLLWARLIVVSRMPRTAIADDGPASAGEVAKVDRRGDADPSRIASDGRELRVSGADQSAPPSTPLRVALHRTPARDPFVISPQFLPRANPFDPSSQSAANAPKLPPNPVEESAQAQARITAQLLAAVDRLKLDAAVAGSMAVINGKTYRLGDVVVGGNPAGSEPVQFRLAEVKTRSAILECQNRRFEIHMPLPGGAGR